MLICELKHSNIAIMRYGAWQLACDQGSLTRNGLRSCQRALVEKFTIYMYLFNIKVQTCDAKIHQESGYINRLIKVT